MQNYSQEEMRDFLATFSSDMRSQMLQEISVAQSQITEELNNKPAADVKVNLAKQSMLLTFATAEIQHVEREWNAINQKIHHGNPSRERHHS